MYPYLKYLHISFVVVSIVLFEYRYFLKIKNIPINKPLKIIPHVNDTLLLTSGITLAIYAGFNPLQQSWLLAKIIALLLYIGFGTLALKSIATKSLVGYLLANLTLIFLVMTAIEKHPFIIGT